MISSDYSDRIGSTQEAWLNCTCYPPPRTEPASFFFFFFFSSETRFIYAALDVLNSVEQAGPELRDSSASQMRGLKAFATNTQHSLFFLLLQGISFYLKEWLRHKLQLFRFEDLAESLPKVNKVSLSFKESKRQHLLPMIKFKLSIEKWEFWSTYICHHELEWFPILKDSSYEIDGDLMNVIFK